jgi:hypothetical protein
MVINAQTKKPTFIPHTHPPQGNSPSTTPTHPLKVQRLSPMEMEDHQRCGLYYNCDEKYALGHRCKEHKLFQIDMTTQALTEDISIEETPELQVEDTNTLNSGGYEPPFSHEEPLISLHALSGISTPQTLKLMGYIKHRKFIVLVDSGSTHNFIHKRVAEETHCFVHPVHNFQIMIPMEV